MLDYEGKTEGSVSGRVSEFFTYKSGRGGHIIKAYRLARAMYVHRLCSREASLLVCMVTSVALKLHV